MFFDQNGFEPAEYLFISCFISKRIILSKKGVKTRAAVTCQVDGRPVSPGLSS